MPIKFRHITPVLPSADIARDVKWYEEKLGFKYFEGNHMYAILHRDNQWVHLQWHADNEDDPLLGGSVMKIFVEEIQPIFEEMVESGSVTKDKLRLNTPWNTNEFGFFDLNKNAIFFVTESD